jgi:hypothetical protein
MKEKLDVAFRCLKAAASKASPASLPEMPYGFETRVLAVWRNQRQVDESGFSILKPAAVCAIIFVVLSFAAHQRLAVSDPPNEWAIADSVIRLSMNP